MLLADVQNLQREKWDWLLPDGLLRKAYASHYLDLDEALAWVLQAEFAKHRGISVQSPKQIEAGTVNLTVGTLEKISSIFGRKIGFVAA